MGCFAGGGWRLAVVSHTKNNTETTENAALRKLWCLLPCVSSALKCTVTTLIASAISNTRLTDNCFQDFYWSHLFLACLWLPGTASLHFQQHLLTASRRNRKQATASTALHSKTHPSQWCKGLLTDIAHIFMARHICARVCVTFVCGSSLIRSRIIFFFFFWYNYCFDQSIGQQGPIIGRCSAILI